MSKKKYRQDKEDQHENRKYSLQQKVIWKFTDTQLIGLTSITAIGYFLYSLVPQGFYQHDEVSHFLNMLEFWNNPNSILGNWAKPGYKLFFVIPALLGIHFVTALNCFISAATSALAYKIAEKLGSRITIAAFFLLASQPVWVQLCFRNYSEPISALLLTGSILLCLNQRFEYAALLVSYGVTIRQEFLILGVGLALYLIYQKRWWTILILTIFPLANNIWGWIFTGDPLYLYNSTIQTGQQYQNAWPKQGFEHYFLMSPVFWGMAIVVLIVVYFSSPLVRNRQHWFVLLPLVVYFLIHCLFNLQSLKIGASTGGNLRYMAVISPLVAIISTLGFENFLIQKDRKKVIFIMIVLLIAVGIWTTYPDNNVRYLENTRDWTHLVAGIIITASLLVFKSNKTLGGFLVITSTILLITTSRPLVLSPEDIAMERMVQWSKSNGVENQSILANHSLFFYYYGKSQYQFTKGASSIDSNTVAKASPQTLILWDSHYSYRPELNPKSVPIEYFTSRPEDFESIAQFISTDQRFGIVVFQKIR